MRRRLEPFRTPLDLCEPSKRSTAACAALCTSSKVRFVTRIFHPNVDLRGQVCIDILHSGMWQPHCTVRLCRRDSHLCVSAAASRRSSRIRAWSQRTASAACGIRACSPSALRCAWQVRLLLLSLLPLLAEPSPAYALNKAAASGLNRTPSALSDAPSGGPPQALPAPTEPREGLAPGPRAGTASAA